MVHQYGKRNTMKSTSSNTDGYWQGLVIEIGINNLWSKGNNMWEKDTMGINFFNL